MPVDAPSPAPSLYKKKKNSWWPCASKLYYLCILLPTCWLAYCNLIQNGVKACLQSRRALGMLGDST